MQKMCRVERVLKILMAPILIFNIALNVGINLIFLSSGERNWRKCSGKVLVWLQEGGQVLNVRLFKLLPLFSLIQNSPKRNLPLFEKKRT